MMPRKVLSWARFKIEAVFFRYTPESTRNLQVHHRQARMVMVRRIRILQGLQTGPASSAETNSGRLSVRIIGWPQVLRVDQAVLRRASAEGCGGLSAGALPITRLERSRDLIYGY
jgi:hypothetical protein